MLAAVETRLPRRAPIVFLAGAPKPVNMRIDRRYRQRSAASDPNYGEARAYTRHARRLLGAVPQHRPACRRKPVVYDATDERVMADILERNQTPDLAAESWIKSEPAVVAAGSRGVTTFGRAALSAMNGASKPAVGSARALVSDHRFRRDRASRVIDRV